MPLNLIFFHGNSSSSREWIKVINILVRKAPNLELHNWNLFGHGGEDSHDNPSMSSQVQFFLDRIMKEIEGDYILVGHSLGGHVAIQMTAKAFERNLKKPIGLITIGSPPISKEKTEIEPWKLNDQVKEVFPLLLKEEAFTEEEAIKFVQCQGFTGKDLEEFVPIAMMVQGKGRLVARECLVPDDSVVDEYHFIKEELKIPYLIIQGEKDGGVNTEYLKTLGKKMIIIPEAEHAAPWTHPKEVSEAIINFLKL